MTKAIDASTCHLCYNAGSAVKTGASPTAASVELQLLKMMVTDSYQSVEEAIYDMIVQSATFIASMMR